MFANTMKFFSQIAHLGFTLLGVVIISFLVLECIPGNAEQLLLSWHYLSAIITISCLAFVITVCLSIVGGAIDDHFYHKMPDR